MMKMVSLTDSTTLTAEEDQALAINGVVSYKEGQHI
jgi:hypothetical protein